MLDSMIYEFQKQFENHTPHATLLQLKSMFEKQASVELFDLLQSFHACKQEEGKSVNSRVLLMKTYLDQLERLNYHVPQIVSIGLILNSIPKNLKGLCATTICTTWGRQ